MDLSAEVVITGMKGSKGRLEDGTVYDVTKVYVQTDLDESKGNMKGFATAEYNYGTADEFERFKHNPFPMRATVGLSIQTNGRTQKTVITSIKPIAPAAPGKA